MNSNFSVSSVFSDETSLFRIPGEPEAGDRVSIRIRLQKNSGAVIKLFLCNKKRTVPMKFLRSDAVFDWFEAGFVCPNEAVFYVFRIKTGPDVFFYTKTGIVTSENGRLPENAAGFVIYPGFHVPEWSKGSLQYQIFPDRFCNGDTSNDVCDREYYYDNDYISHAKAWDEKPGLSDYRCFYGGDLPGIAEKLDYLQSLGVETIYLNPIFVSPTPHKYDTQDYAHIDPHLTVISRDGGSCLNENVTDNKKASRYILRTADSENLKKSNEYFASFCKEVHSRGMKIILDGVFNHCGSFNRWLDAEGIYKKSGDGSGAYNNIKSPYRDYFGFEDKKHYESWCGFQTLPKLNYERSEELCESILSIGEMWALPPYSIDGWRLDVGADLGHSREFNHEFWKRFRKRVKDANPNTVILAEHYGDPFDWLKGDEWDTVMNYDAFMEPVTFFLTGMEKHSDYRRDDLYQNGEAFVEMMKGAMARFPLCSLQCAMNELSNHDHSRFLTRTNGVAGRLDPMGSDAADTGVNKAVMREAVLMQMTWPGAPTIYYGDEAGLCGWTDPDNRRTYPWGSEDFSLIDFHRALADLRKRMPVLKNGSLKFLCAGYGYVAYARFDGKDTAVILCNNLDSEQKIRMPLRDLGITDGTEIRRCLLTHEDGFSLEVLNAGICEDGCSERTISARSAAIYMISDK